MEKTSIDYYFSIDKLPLGISESELLTYLEGNVPPFISRRLRYLHHEAHLEGYFASPHVPSYEWQQNQVISAGQTAVIQVSSIHQFPLIPEEALDPKILYPEALYFYVGTSGYPVFDVKVFHNMESIISFSFGLYGSKEIRFIEKFKGQGRLGQSIDKASHSVRIELLKLHPKLLYLFEIEGGFYYKHNPIWIKKLAALTPGSTFVIRRSLLEDSNNPVISSGMHGCFSFTQDGNTVTFTQISAANKTGILTHGGTQPVITIS